MCAKLSCTGPIAALFPCTDDLLQKSLLAKVFIAHWNNSLHIETPSDRHISVVQSNKD